MAVGSALFPPDGLRPANSPEAPAAPGPEAEVVAKAEAGAEIAPIETAAADAGAAPDPAPSPEAAVPTAPPPEPASSGTGAADNATADVASAPVTDDSSVPPTAAAETTPAPETGSADPTPAAEPDPQDEAATGAAAEPGPGPLAPETAPDLASDVAATEAGPGPKAAEVATIDAPVPPPAPLPLPQLDTDAVLTALDRAAGTPLPAPGAVTGEAAPEAAPAAPETAVAEVAPAGEAPVLPEATVPETPAPADAPPAAEPPVAEAEAVPEAVPMPAPAPQDSETAELPGTAAPDMPGTQPDELPGAPDAAEVEVAEAPDAATDQPSGSTFKPAGSLTDRTEGVIVGRLPRIGDAPATEEAEAEAAAEAAPEDSRPIALHAASFENPEGKPLMSIVLIDRGSADLDRAALAELPFPVTFALDPLDPASSERAQIYRAGGKEVVMLATGIAEGATASDIEVAFQSMARGLPEAVAVMELAQPVFQQRRSLASLVVPVVGGQGRGLLTWDQGLNAADQVARRDGVPSGIVFRDLGSAGTEVDDVRRVLDRAVFKAGQDGSVIVAGDASSVNVAALLVWTVEGRAATVALAPLTAVLTTN